MSNMSATISLHNQRPLRPRITKYGCNCRRREKCQLQSQCFALNLISQADVENNAIALYLTLKTIRFIQIVIFIFFIYLFIFFGIS